MATGSPTWRTRSRASSGISTGTNSSRARAGMSGAVSPRSCAVSTASTPGVASASSVSMAAMRAAGCGDRTKARWRRSGRRRSSTNAPLPVRWRRCSTARMDRPTQRPSADWAWGRPAALAATALRPSPGSAERGRTSRLAPTSALIAHRPCQRAPQQDGGELLAVLGAAVDVRPRLDRPRRGLCGLLDRLAAELAAGEHVLGRLHAQRDLVDAPYDHPRAGAGAVLHVDRGGCRDDGEVAVAAGELLDRRAVRRAREAHLRDDLARFERRGEEAQEEVGGRDAALAGRPACDELSAEQERQHAPLRRRVAVRDRAAERAARADRE